MLASRHIAGEVNHLGIIHGHTTHAADISTERGPVSVCHSLDATVGGFDNTKRSLLDLPGSPNLLAMGEVVLEAHYFSGKHMAISVRIYTISNQVEIYAEIECGPTVYGGNVIRHDEI
jgi:hypothetical protein